MPVPSNDEARYLEHQISHFNIMGHWTLNIRQWKQNNPFIQIVNKHMNGTILKNCLLLLNNPELQIFHNFFWVNPDWKYFQNITCKNSHVTSLSLFYNFMGPSVFSDASSNLSEVFDCYHQDCPLDLGLGDSMSLSIQLLLHICMLHSWLLVCWISHKYKSLVILDLTLDSKIQLTHDSSSIVCRLYPNIVLSKAFEFCSQSVIGSAWSPLKGAEISL